METQPDSPHHHRVDALPSPDALRRALPASQAATALVADTRRQIAAVLDGRDRRLLVIVGPCSIHDPTAALEYAERLSRLRSKLAGELLICMRVFLEKPRTALGWKGLLNDPRLDGSCELGEGLTLGRKLLLALAERGMPAATETLDPLGPHYLGDLVAWTAIGARTSESQTHRELASGLPMPVSFKNGTDGGLDAAINAMRAASAGHSFFGIDGAGQVGVVRTRGNPHTHLTLRGGRGRPNYRDADVQRACEALRQAGLRQRVLIDCSHDNSGKDHKRQPEVLAEVLRQVEAGSEHILGVMLESNLVAGRQELLPGQPLAYGQSITDACMDFDTTERLLCHLAATRAVSQPRAATAQSAQPM
jgi:3-deoxy-7-phosphoheptulonate synthase